MSSFREVLTASDAELVKIFYKIAPSDESDFIKKINSTAAQIGLNHSQLVCALGFNTNIRDLTDILSVVGFSSYKLLTYRRNELFANDIYRHLDIDNIVDVYAEHIEDEDILATLRELLPARLGNIEALLADSPDPAALISYKMEVHSVYSGGVVTAELINQRLESPIGGIRVMIEEIQMIVESDLLPRSNMFFSEHLLPAEKRFLIENGDIDQSMIVNRLKNSEVSEDERQMLEDFVE